MWKLFRNLVRRKDSGLVPAGIEVNMWMSTVYVYVCVCVSVHADADKIVVLSPDLDSGAFPLKENWTRMWSAVMYNMSLDHKLLNRY